MDAVLDLLNSLINVARSLLDVLVSLLRIILPWLPLLAWIGFWLFAVNWSKAFPILRRGGAIGVLLAMFIAVLVWGSVAPPEGGTHSLLGLAVSNYAGKFMYVTMLACMALLCGSVQMSGALGRLAEFPEPVADDHHGHGHDGHHQHDTHHGLDHGHAATGDDHTASAHGH
jgi:hypothetical protein